MSTPTERPAMQIVTSRLAQLIQEIRTEYEAVGESFHAGLEHAVRVGLGLLEAKELVPHGEWLPWLAANVGFSPRTAQVYMRVASNTQTSAHLSIDKALKLLATPNPRGNSVFVPRELPTGSFNIILADPPWRYDFSETESRAIESKYPTMTLEEICALQVPAADDAVLFLWATAPKNAEAVEVIKSWGFEYKSQFVWCKDKFGMGYYARNQHELLMIATRGQWSPPPAELRQSSVIEAPRTKHSQKPDEFYGLIERMYPEGVNRLELFARRSREGWESWGNEL